MMNRREYLKNCFALGVSYFVVSPLVSLAQLNQTSSSIQLRFNIGLKNVSDQALSSAQFWLALPANTPQQTLQDIQVSTEYRLVSDVLGQNFMQFALPSISPFATKLLNLQVTIDRTPETKQAHSTRQQWLGHERLLEVEDGTIQGLAKTLKHDDDLRTCQAIFDWVRTHIDYAGYIADNLGARYALTHRKGDCTEYACLVVALARANGIPARMVGGYFLYTGRMVKARDYHHWAEVYINGAWHLLDAQKQNWQRHERDYVVYEYYQTWQPTKLGLSKRYKVSPKLEVSY